mgnify:CR=1 FL=1
MYSLFLRFTTEDKTNGKAEIVVSLAADIELSHKANMVKEFNADTRREKHRGAFAWKVFIAHNIIEGDNRRAELSRTIRSKLRYHEVKMNILIIRATSGIGHNL